MMKKEVAPKTCKVQFISPPSDIDAVEMQSRKQLIKERIPKLFTFC